MTDRPTPPPIDALMAASQRARSLPSQISPRLVLRAAHLLADSARRMPRAVDHLLAIEPDGTPTGGDGAPTHSAGSPTEAAVAARHQWRKDADRLTHAIDAVMSAVHRLDHVVGALASKAEHTSEIAARLRCTGGQGERGAEVWGDALCTAIAAPGARGLCEACRRRRSRWRRKQGLQ